VSSLEHRRKIASHSCDGEVNENEKEGARTTNRWVLFHTGNNNVATRIDPKTEKKSNLSSGKPAGETVFEG
jgi:hypothetical protein